MNTRSNTASSITKLASNSQKNVYYSDDAIQITDQYIRIYTEFHMIDHINTVSTHVIRPNYIGAILFGGILGFAVGLLLAILLLPSFVTLNTRGMSSFGTVIILICIILGAVIAYLLQRKQYVFQIRMSSGEIDRIYSKDDEYIRTLRKAGLDAVINSKP